MYSDLYMQQGKKNHFALIMNGFAYANVIKAKQEHGMLIGDYESDYCINKIKDAIKMLELIGYVQASSQAQDDSYINDSDTYTNELIHYYRTILSYEKDWL